jgi:hypothetical protein
MIKDCANTKVGKFSGLVCQTWGLDSSSIDPNSTQHFFGAIGTRISGINILVELKI